MLLMLATLATAGCSYLPFSGGELSGTLTPPPEDWTDVAAVDIVSLETQPSDPYSVKLWVLGVGPDLYVHAGANRATWVEHIEANPDVRLLVGENLYELQAVQVKDQAEFDRFAEPYEAKYGNRPRNENVSEVYLYRLEKRG
jgi:hypothetical protein